MSDREEIRASFANKRAALRTVAGTLAAFIDASDEADLFGYDLDLTPAQRRRLEWAVAEVQRRLWQMGN